jgi:hypothetical protein
MKKFDVIETAIVEHSGRNDEKGLAQAKKKELQNKYVSDSENRYNVQSIRSFKNGDWLWTIRVYKYINVNKK